jgi:hypothetical protein
MLPMEFIWKFCRGGSGIRTGIHMETPLKDGGLIDFFLGPNFCTPKYVNVCAFIQYFHNKIHSLPVWIHAGIAEYSIWKLFVGIVLRW